ncbi:MAG TPA: septum formation inhibitor [Bacteroidales bacterium]|nr:septum formation inhibitor [Bacteroidales bacterium]HPS72809.1 septum formation inhibitor [Bacteroidales bacterium]
MLKKILNILLNKYLITTVAFVVWLFFFDSNNMIMQQDLKSKLNDLKEEKQFYLDEIRNDSILTRQLLTDTAALEKFAREKYLMKKEGEDVFLMIDTTADQHPQ